MYYCDEVDQLYEVGIELEVSQATPTSCLFSTHAQLPCDLLLGAVDTVLSLANQENATSTQDPATSASAQLSNRPTHGSSSHRATQDGSSQFSRAPGSSSSASIEEHRRLFGYKPKKVNSLGPLKRGRRKASTWKTRFICLRHRTSLEAIFRRED